MTTSLTHRDSALTENNGVGSLFSNASSFRKIVERDGAPLYAVLWSFSEDWALATDGVEVVLLQVSSIQRIIDDAGGAIQELKELFLSAENRMSLDRFAAENLVANDRAYFAYHKTDEYGAFSGNYFYSSQKRANGSYLYVVSRSEREYYFEGVYSISDVLDGVENPYGKRYSYRLYELEKPIDPVRITHRFGTEFFRGKISGGLPMQSASSQQQVLFRNLIAEADNVPFSDAGYLQSINENLELDRIAQVKVRGEQSYIRKQLFGDNKLHQCIVCEEMIPVQLLVAAHISVNGQ